MQRRRIDFFHMKRCGGVTVGEECSMSTPIKRKLGCVTAGSITGVVRVTNALPGVTRSKVQWPIPGRWCSHYRASPAAQFPSSLSLAAPWASRRRETRATCRARRDASSSRKPRRAAAFVDDSAEASPKLYPASEGVQRRLALFAVQRHSIYAVHVTEPLYHMYTAYFTAASRPFECIELSIAVPGTGDQCASGYWFFFFSTFNHLKVHCIALSWYQRSIVRRKNICFERDSQWAWPAVPL